MDIKEMLGAIRGLSGREGYQPTIVQHVGLVEASVERLENKLTSATKEAKDYRDTLVYVLDYFGLTDRYHLENYAPENVASVIKGLSKDADERANHV